MNVAGTASVTSTATAYAAGVARVAVTVDRPRHHGYGLHQQQVETRPAKRPGLLARLWR